MSLFPSASTRTELPLVQFKAGKCNLIPQDDGSFLVTPDLKKGKISLHKGADNLIHFKWTDRSTNAVVSDLLVFPDEVVFKKVVTGTPADRVYMLKWKIGDRREMFWLQDKRTDNDSENCEKINRFINNPDANNQASESDNLVRMLRGGRPAAARGAIPAAAAAPPANRHSNAFGLDLGRIIQGIQAPATAGAPVAAPDAAEPALPQAPSATAASGSQPLLSADALRQAMSGMTLPPPASQAAERTPPTDINRVLSPDAIIATGVLNDPEVRQSLLALLPESQQSDSSLEENLRSPQLQQALDALAGALQSENYSTVMSNLGLDPSAGMPHLMRGDAIGAFLAAAAARGEQTRQQQQQEGAPAAGTGAGEGGAGGEEKKSDESDDMDQYYS